MQFGDNTILLQLDDRTAANEAAVQMLKLAADTVCRLCGAKSSLETVIAVINRGEVKDGRQSADVFGLCPACVAGMGRDEIIDKLNSALGEA